MDARRQDPIIAELLAAAALLRHQANELVKAAREMEKQARTWESKAIESATRSRYSEAEDASKV